MPTGVPSPASARRAALLVWGALLVVYVVWGSTYLGIRVVVESMPPLLTASVRFLAAGAIVLGWLAFRNGAAVLRLDRREVAASLLIGAALLLAGNGLVSLGERDVPSGLTALIIAAVPFWVVLLRAATGERPSRAGLAGVLVGFAGVGVLVLPQGLGGSVAPLGMLLILISSFSWACGSFASRFLRLPSDPLVSTGYQLVFGGLLLGATGIIAGEGAHLDPSRFSLPSVVALVYLVLAGSVLAYTTYTWLLQNAPIGQVATYAYVNPVVAVLLGALVLHERIDAWLVLGAVIVVGAVVVIVTSESRETKQAVAERGTPASPCPVAQPDAPAALDESERAALRPVQARPGDGA